MKKNKSKKQNENKKKIALIVVMFLLAFFLLKGMTPTTPGTTTTPPTTLTGTLGTGLAGGTGGVGTPTTQAGSTPTTSPDFSWWNNGWTMPTFPSFTMPTFPCLFGCGTPTTSAPTTQGTGTTLTFSTTMIGTTYPNIGVIITTLPTFYIPTTTTTTQIPCFTDVDCGISETCSSGRGWCEITSPKCIYGAKTNFCGTQTIGMAGSCYMVSRGNYECVTIA
jgi:hypothetical protein